MLSTALPARRPSPAHASQADLRSEPGLPQPENKRFYPALDGLRALAVLLVFFHHYNSSIWPRAQWGWVGVDIFFVLSGFLITGILYDSQQTKRRFLTFYARRSLRIFPLYYAIVLLALLTTPIFHFDWTSRWALWPLYLGNYTHILSHSSAPQNSLDWLSIWSAAPRRFFGDRLSFGHLWSLSLEEQFYLVWPCVVFTVKDRRRLIQLCLSFILCMPLVRALATALLPQHLLQAEILYRSTFFRADALLLGGAIALLLRGPRARLLSRYCWPTAAVALCALLLTKWIAVHLLHAAPGGLPLVPWVAIVGFTYVDVMAGCLLVAALQPATPLYRLLLIKPLPQLGRISYGFYVFHDIFHPAFMQWGEIIARRAAPQHAHGIGVLLALLGTVVLAVASYNLYEVPFLKLKKYFTPASNS